jgi:hypothetical protein
MSAPAGWYPDPTSRHQNRWFDGNDWTDQVADGQVVGTDPVQAGAAASAAQPAPAATPDPSATAVIPVASGPPPGAPGGSPPGGTPSLGEYSSPGSGSASSGKGKTVLLVGVVVALIAVAVGLVLTLGGGDDSGEAADSSSASDGPDEDTTTTTDDPSASDLFDDMADTGSDGGGDIFGTDDEPADDPADSTVPPDDSSGNAYPQEVIDNFTTSCENAGSPASFCGCVIDALQQDVPYDRFVEIDQELADDPSNIPAELTDAAAGCQ